MKMTIDNPTATRYDRVIVTGPDGTKRTLSRDEFEALPLRERVNYLMEGAAQFFLLGESVSARDAMMK
jgi:hypothetical protein